MAQARCHCNGSSGTDCYWCAGSGIKENNEPKVQNSRRKHIGNSTPKKRKLKKGNECNKIIIPSYKSSKRSANKNKL
jgi:hypothetical protein